MINLMKMIASIITTNLTQQRVYFYGLLLTLSLLLPYEEFSVRAQKPSIVVNHTSSNSIPTSQLNYKLRNGRIREIPPIPPPTTAASVPSRRALYEEFDSTGVPPYGGRRDNRRRLNLAQLSTSGGGRGAYVNGVGGGRQSSVGGGGGIESLRKELMKPSVGGPGGGISGHSAGYPSYSATSSIGQIDGIGSLGPAHRYGDILQMANYLRSPADAAMHSTYPSAIVGTEHQPNSISDRYTLLVPEKSSISNIMRLHNEVKQQQQQQRLNGVPSLAGQADEPIDVVEGDIILNRHTDPLEVIRDQIRNSSPQSGPYVGHSEAEMLSILGATDIEELLGVRCTFESPCAWQWTQNLVDGFHVMSGTEVAKNNMTGLYPGPLADSLEDANGHFLYARLLPTTLQINLTSPQFHTTMEKCVLEVFIHQSGMSHGLYSVVVEPLHSQENSWVPSEIIGDNYRQWSRKFFKLGRISRDFRIVFEIVPKLLEGQRAHVAIDNLRMVNCFPEGTKAEKCGTSQIKCMMNKVPVCIPLPRICDITRDCDDAEDELLNCDKIPYGGRCDFENDWCGWRDSGKTILSWSRHTGSSPTHDTGPEGDHTFQHLINTTGGYYMLVNMNQHSNNSEKGALIGFASNAIMVSKTFNPPPLVHGNPNSPYRNSCVVRFYIHQFGKNPGSINLSVVEMKEKENITTTLWWSTKNLGADWLRAEYVLPNITSRYYLQFEARMGMRIYSDVAVDDFSLSPECFGLNIPKEFLKDYNYWDVRHRQKSPSHRDFEHRNYLELTSCDTRGMIGPTKTQCENHYHQTNRSHVLKEITVIDDQNIYKGMQRWKVPHEGYYSIIVKGASGGLGSGGVGSSRGAVAQTVLELHKHEELYILVGQQGENACIKTLNYKEEGCANAANTDFDLSQHNFNSKQQLLRNFNIERGAGGGGGGSYVFLLNSAKNEAIPLVVAGGGGGLGIGLYIDEDFQHGQKSRSSKLALTGQIVGDRQDLRKDGQRMAGPGGGWRSSTERHLNATYGFALLQGGKGGESCYNDGGGGNNQTASQDHHGQGGFGGGGGGCDTGGGGGGYAGGDVYLNESNGEGGSSYISSSRSLKEFNAIYEGANFGSGSVIIIPAIEGCGCDYRCIAMDEYRTTVRCICPEGWRLKRDNNTSCEMLYEERIPFSYLIGFFITLVVLLGAALTALIVILYNRYQRKKQAKLRHKMLLEQDLQLSRLRHNIDDPTLNNFNPNYGCDGFLNGHVDVNTLPQVARESLRLVKALGQGAFGEVYQGLYRHRDGDAVEMPVAVKTLPEMSTRQAEEDFLMEAAIMAKFNHPNMVHLIGVCFDRHPRFIVLELLAGGDLKNFLREGRSKPDRPSALTMKDLVFCALDVAKGCRYMESKRFIHRDIAARNCLLSSKGPGRVVKIADFGMARDIYRSDYYRKGGKAMLPIKWMPPEAFLDGIFTSKTDVWSFGVLLWEVFSLGLMPYTGLPNPEVMQLVTNGGRLGSPPGCPAAIYKIMADCWNPTPEDRPSFSSLLERLTTCTQDPGVMNTPLPCIMRAPSAERDQTVMRPPRADEFCLQVPHTDYLIPLPGIQNTEEGGVTSVNNQQSIRPVAVSTIGTDVCTPPGNLPPSAPSSTDDGGSYSQMDDNDTTAEANGHWETSFIQTVPNSSTNCGNPSTGFSSSPRSVNAISTNDGRIHNRLEQSTTINANYTDINNENNESKLLSVAYHHHGNDINGNNNSSAESETKLISLDTPQPTPTNIQPPVSFSAQLDGITLDPSTLKTSLNHLVAIPVTVSSTTANLSDCHLCPTSGYANLQLLNKNNNNNNNNNNNHTNNNNNNNNNETASQRYREIVPPDMDPLTKESLANRTTNTITATEKLKNGSVYRGDGGSTKTPRTGMQSTTTAQSTSTSGGNASIPLGGNHRGLPPFTVQSYAERYTDNHSEISC